MGFDSTSGISKLGEVISRRAQAVNDMNPQVLDVGLIQKDYSLKTNNFSRAIPRTDYSVCRQLTLGATGDVLTTTANDGSHTHPITSGGPHSHSVLIPEKMRSIKPGDRVLVVWVQNEAVVVDILTRL